MAEDDVDLLMENQILELRSNLPAPRSLSRSEKLKLIESIGAGTVRNIVDSKKNFPQSRIPFLFNSIDSQDVVDILNNDWEGLLPRKKRAR